jgi:glycosyltransferase involved in cell wall biosynthesis
MKHISVCICTYKRADFLTRLLRDLAKQRVNDRFTFSIIVADNDSSESARAQVAEFRRSSDIEIWYCVEPRQNIALTRNKAIENSRGEFIAFIDDDEFPAEDWLITLFEVCEQHNVAGVLGPVKRHFDEAPPTWIVAGDFYERPTYPTGTRVEWPAGRTGNLLFRREILNNCEEPFRPEFRAGEDKDFFRRMIERGYTFIWCDEAVAFEVVPPSRWKRGYMLRKALLRGQITVVHPTFGAKDVCKSLIAVPVYLVVLPFTLLLGHHRFMKLLVSLFDHLGSLLAVLGFNPIKQQYVTD